MKRIFVDDSKCLSCHSCELACAVAHSRSGTLFAAVAQSPPPAPRVSVEVSGRGAFPLQCRHCDDPQCVRACVSKALYRDGDTGAVRHDPNRCIGCWMCAMACPFGSIECHRQDGRSAVRKCDLCMDRGAAPACADACPTGAIRFEEVGNFSRTRRRAYLSQRIVDYVEGE